MFPVSSILNVKSVPSVVVACQFLPRSMHERMASMIADWISIVVGICVPFLCGKPPEGYHSLR